MRLLVLSLKLATVPSSHGGFLQKIQQETGPLSLGVLVGILLILVSLVGRVYADGKQFSDCTPYSNCLII